MVLAPVERNFFFVVQKETSRDSFAHDFSLTVCTQASYRSLSYVGLCSLASKHRRSYIRRSYTGYKFDKKMLYSSNLARKKSNISKKIERH